MSVHRVLPRARTQRSPPTSGSEAELQGSPAPGDRLGPLQSSGDVVRTHVERVSSRPLIRWQSLNFAFKSTAARTISPALLRWFLRTLAMLLCHGIISLAVTSLISPHTSCSSLPWALRYFCLYMNPQLSSDQQALSSVSSGDTVTTTPIGAQPRNLAIASHGAKILQKFSNFGKPPRTWWPGVISPLGPEQVLNEGLEDCWEFTGSAALLAIRLAECGNITHAVINHPVIPGRLPYSIREVVLWGMVDGDEASERLVKMPKAYDNLLARVESQPSIFAGYTFLPLMAFTYNGSIGGRQAFEVFEQVREIGVEFGVVVGQIRSNWGAASTLLCEMSILGTPENIAV